MKMASKFKPVDTVEDLLKDPKRNNVLKLISITLLTLMVIFAWKFIINLFYEERVMHLGRSEITTILSACLSINIVAYLLLNRYRLLLLNVTVKTTSLFHANNNLKLEIETRKRAEANLESIEVRYQALMENVGEGILILDGQGNLVEANQKMKELLEASDAEITAMKLIQILPNQDLENHRPFLEEVVHQGKSQLSNRWIIWKKHKIPVDITGVKVADGGKTLIQLIFRNMSAGWPEETVWSRTQLN